jgi:spermidine synthase
LISIEVSSIWFAGAGSLYNREFYTLLNQKLESDGVLQQWLQLHRIDVVDMAHVLGSLRSVFEYVQLYRVGHQGVILASSQPLIPNRASLVALTERLQMTEVVNLWEGNLSGALDGCLLGSGDVDNFLGGFPSDTMSTDDNLFLEYHTPKGNVRPYLESFQSNINKANVWFIYPAEQLAGICRLGN